MQVGAGVVVEVVFVEGFGFLLGGFAVEGGEGGEVELELDAGGLELAVVGGGHVEVTLGVGEDGVVACRLDALQHAV